MEIDAKTKTLLENPTKRRAWIIYQLALQDRSLASIARETGVSRQAVWQALIKPYPRVERIIAEYLDMEPYHLFPERYNSDGKPNRQRGRPRKIYSQDSNAADVTQRNIKEGANAPELIKEQ